MRAGALQYLIEIQQQIEANNEFGEPIVTWQKMANRYASIRPIRGTERYISLEKHAEVTHEIEIRYLADSRFSPKCRIKFRDRIFDIISILNIGERNKQVKILAKEQV